MQSLRTILCYGDSNTWGQVPLRDFRKKRYPFDVRWTGLLQRALGDSYRIVEDGVNGRTTGLEDPLRRGRNGTETFHSALDAHVPLDLVILMLGTNDLKSKFSPNVESITGRVRELVRVAKRITSEDPHPATGTRILVLAPVVVRPEFYPNDDLAYPESGSIARGLAPAYARMGREEGVDFFDVSTVVTASDQDGAHLDEKNHALLAGALAKRVRDLFDPSLRPSNPEPRSELSDGG